MPAVTANLDGVQCEVERMPDGRIRVRYQDRSMNQLSGPLTGSMVEYLVHPVQSRQYDVLNALIAGQPDTSADTSGGTVADGSGESQPSAVARPWWSLAAGERAGFKE